MISMLDRPGESNPAGRGVTLLGALPHGQVWTSRGASASVNSQAHAPFAAASGGHARQRTRMRGSTVRARAVELHRAHALAREVGQPFPPSRLLHATRLGHEAQDLAAFGPLDPVGVDEAVHPQAQDPFEGSEAAAGRKPQEIQRSSSPRRARSAPTPPRRARSRRPFPTAPPPPGTRSRRGPASSWRTPRALRGVARGPSWRTRSSPPSVPIAQRVRSLAHTPAARKRPGPPRRFDRRPLS